MTIAGEKCLLKYLVALLIGSFIAPVQVVALGLLFAFALQRIIFYYWIRS